MDRRVFSLRWVATLLCAGCMAWANAQEVKVTITTDEGGINAPVLERMQRGLSQVLSEVNQAHREKRPLHIVGLDMTEFAQESLITLWANVHFYCDDTEVVERCWVFDGGKEYMLSHIPLIMDLGDEEFGNGTYQEAVVDFDAQGAIKDFRFSMNCQLGESMEDGGDVVDVEREMIIYKYCERFRTAYNKKDMAYLRQVFSDDALIITGNVVRNGEQKMKTIFTRQPKQVYLANLERAFLRNKWIDVKFSKIGENGEQGGPGGITRSKVNPNMYGVRLRQEWKSSSYSDVGYLFLLWDFTNENAPVIHVRTWQPEWVGGVHQEPDDGISTLGAFDL